MNAHERQSANLEAGFQWRVSLPLIFTTRIAFAISITLRYITSHFITWHFIESLNDNQWQSLSLYYLYHSHWICNLNYIMLRYIILNYVTLRCITLHFIELCHITSHNNQCNDRVFSQLLPLALHFQSQLHCVCFHCIIVLYHVTLHDISSNHVT